MRCLPFALVFLVSLAVIVAASPIKSVPLSANSTDWNDHFTTRQDVWVRFLQVADCTDGSTIIVGPNHPAPVDVYVVNDKDGWHDGDSLSPYFAKKTIVTDPSGLIPPTLVWALPTLAGKYDMIIDLNRDGLFNDTPQCQELVDNDTGVGFWVRGSGTTLPAGGDTAVPDHGYWDDSAGSRYNVMQHLLVTPAGEGVEIKGITLRASGTGDDRADISRIDIINDRNGNGAYDVGTDAIVGNGTYQADNAIAGIVICPQGMQGYAQNCPMTVADGATGHLLVAYEMGNLPAGKTYSLTVQRLNGIGQGSGQVVELLTSLINGATKTILNPACRGGFGVQFQPDPAFLGMSTEATVSGTLAAGCSGTPALLWLGRCGSGTSVGACTVSGGSCTLRFNAPGAAGTYDYWACIDKDGDGRYASIAESMGPFSLEVVPQPACRPGNVAGCTNQTGCEGNGGGWCGGDNSCEEVSDIDCQPPASSGSWWCTSHCTWSTCAGTDGSCYSSGGSCRPCNPGEGCEDFACVAGQTPGCDGISGLDASYSERTVSIIAGVATPCNWKVVGFRENDCNGAVMGSCLVSGSGCTGTWTVTGPGTHVYAACMDINGDGLYNGQYESASVSVTVPEGFPWLLVAIIAILLAAGCVALYYYFGVYAKKKKKAVPKAGR